MTQGPLYSWELNQPPKNFTQQNPFLTWCSSLWVHLLLWKGYHNKHITNIDSWEQQWGSYHQPPIYMTPTQWGRACQWYHRSNNTLQTHSPQEATCNVPISSPTQQTTFLVWYNIDNIDFSCRQASTCHVLLRGLNEGWQHVNNRWTIMTTYH